MKIRIEIELTEDVRTGFDVAEVIKSEFKTFVDGREPLEVNERGPFFDRSTGFDIGTWEVIA